MFWAYGILVFSLIIFVLISLLIIKNSKKIGQSLESIAKPQKAEIIGRFSYTNEEWEHVFRQEFVEDEKGKGFFNQYSGFISYDQIVRENTGCEIFFTTREIYLTNGKQGKSFRLNSMGNGWQLYPMVLLNLSPLKKLRVRISGIQSLADSNSIEFEKEYLVPIPESSLEKIDEIIKAYGQIVLDS